VASLSPLEKVLASGEKLRIRSAKRTDAARTLDLYRSIVHQSEFTLAERDEVTRSVADEQAALTRDLEAAGNLCVVGTIGREVVGMARLASGPFRRTRHVADLTSVWVREEWRRRGVARALFEPMLAWAEAHPELEKINLNVFSTSTAAVQLYESLGFAREGRGVHDMKLAPGRYADTIFMGRSVANAQKRG